MKPLFILAGIFTLFSFGPSVVAQADVCTPSPCECKPYNTRMSFFVQGQFVTDFGSPGRDSAIRCQEYMNAQSYCGTVVRRSPCECKVYETRMTLFVQGYVAANFGSPGSDSMINCLNYMNEQPYCR